MRGRPGTAALLACVAVTAVGPAAPVAHARDRQPSAQELWREYPLGTSTPGPPDRGAVPTAAPVAPAPTRAAAVRRADPQARGSGGGFDPAWIIVGVLLAVAAVPGWMLFARRPPDEPADEPQPGPAPPPVAARRPAARAPEPLRTGRFGPPSPGHEWTAEITWRRSGAECHFSVTAMPAQGGAHRILAETAALEWPPAGPSGVQAMTDAVEALERSLLADGWRPLPPGEAWYAKRFASPPETQSPARSRERAGSPS